MAAFLSRRNREAFGAAGDPPGHGHDYQCVVTVGGPLDENGMIIDLVLLDRVLRIMEDPTLYADCTGTS